jgi:hypothetical protein
MPTDPSPTDPAPADPAPAEPVATYAFTPRPFGREIRLALFAGALEVDDQRRNARIPLASITAARLTFEPRNTLARGYRLRLSCDDRRSVALTNISWRSMVEAESKTAAYRAFLAALLPAVAQANPACRFLAGRPPLAWAALALVTLATFGLIAYVAWRTLPNAGPGAALFVGAFAIVFAWLAIDMVARNRPRRFAADHPPPDLLP